MMSEEYWIDRTNSGERDEVQNAVSALNYDFEKEFEFLMADPLLRELWGTEPQQPFSSSETSPMEPESRMSFSDDMDALPSHLAPTMDIVFPTSEPLTHIPPFHQASTQRKDTGLRESILEDDFPMEQNFASPFSDDGYLQWVSSAGSSDGSSSTGIGPTKAQRSRRAGGANGRSMEELSKMDPVKVKRILSNRASAARSKQRRKQELEYLQDQTQFLAKENERLRTQVRQMDWLARESVQAIEQRRHQIATLQNNIAALNFSNNALEEQHPSPLRSSQAVLRPTREEFTSLLNNNPALDYPYEEPRTSMSFQDYFLPGPMMNLCEGLL